MISVSDLQAAVQTLCLDGWLFSGFHHRDPLSEELLGVSPSNPATRQWFYLVTDGQKDPLKIIHTIESTVLAHLPGNTEYYSTENDLARIFARLRNQRIAVHMDIHIPVFSLLDAATYQLLCYCGLKLVSASPLILTVKGALQSNQQEQHKIAAQKLYSITAQTWGIISSAVHNSQRISEKNVQDFILERFEKEQLITDHPPITAFGHHTADPHYSTADSTCLLQHGDSIQLDIWAKCPGGIYADISWFGVCTQKVPQNIQDAFDAVIGARNGVVQWLSAELAAERFPSGADADTYVRTYLDQHGLLPAVRHRTGHAIDTECHGCGVNLDSIEFPDFRHFCEGSLFSVEPGVYFVDYGIRTEINVLIQNGVTLITGNAPIQQKIVTIS